MAVHVKFTLSIIHPSSVADLMLWGLSHIQKKNHPGPQRGRIRIYGDKVTHKSLVAQQTSGKEVLGSNTASPTMILMRCRIIVL